MKLKKILFSIFILTVSIFTVACESEEPVVSKSPELQEVESEIETDIEWTIYWYLCGSDLETNYGSATNDLAELLEVQLPENVKILIETGGSEFWQNDLINPEVIGRYLYDSEGLQLISELPSANMGEKETFSDFLKFGKENYPAKNTAVIFWNHGGGSVAGVAFDQLYGMDSLNLEELREGFAETFGKNPENPPIDLIGFDACLMATLDTANALAPIGKYLVASQELEPGNGWLYSGWVGELAKNPKITALELSKAICDTYLIGCELVGTEDSITLSVVDLSKMDTLVSAYDDFGKEALSMALEDPAFFTYFSKVANSIENYGGNTREQGYTNMTDLGSLVLQSSDILNETSSNLISAIDEAVVYKVNGKYRPESMGISAYYSYNSDIDDLEAYAEIGPSESFKYLYTYGLTGTLPSEGVKYIENMSYTSVPELMTLNNVDWEDVAVTVDEDGNSTLTLGPDAINILSSLTFELYYADTEQDILLCLGSDNDIIADWETGIFKDNFRGVWGSLDGALCYMEISYEGDGYNQYSIPILLNGEEYNLIVIYDFEVGEYFIEGARKPLDESGAADKNLRYLVEGDEIQTIHYVTTISGEDQELVSVPIDTIIVTPETSFAETELGDGLFIMMYAMHDSQGNINYSAAVTFETIDGEIYTTVE